MNKELDVYEKEFKYLERVRKSGITNMYGASRYLSSEFGMPKPEAHKVLAMWMENYDELARKFRWKKKK